MGSVMPTVDVHDDEGVFAVCLAFHHVQDARELLASSDPALIIDLDDTQLVTRRSWWRRCWPLGARAIPGAGARDDEAPLRLHVSESEAHVDAAVRRRVDLREDVLPVERDDGLARARLRVLAHRKPEL